MSRPPRSDLTDVPQHVIQRGNARLPCFHDDNDRRRYLFALDTMASRYECAVHAYVLMTNHVHLLVTPNVLGGVSRMMQGIGRCYVAEFNARHARTGTLWEGRYKSCLVDAEGYVLACYRYIELNPVRAAIVATPSDYVWSSHLTNSGRKANSFLHPHDAYLALGSMPESRAMHYENLFRDALPDARVREIRNHVQQQRPLGTAPFRAMVSREIRRQTGRGSESL